MLHNRTRHLRKLIQSSLKFSPIVGIFGHRQVGKTTLAQLIGAPYITLDLRENLELAHSDPRALLRRLEGTPVNIPLVIDECQMAPPLFSEMKEWVRSHPRPGQLLLTGSVRFSSRKAIRESLTGRIITWELLPMDLSETFGAPLPNALVKLLENKKLEFDLTKSRYFNDKVLHQYLIQGGLPGVFTVRNTAVREQKFATQIETILERDLRLLVPTTLPFRTLRTLFSELAATQGAPLDLAALSRKTRISAPSVKKLISAFESLFLIRVIPSDGTSRKPVCYLEDQGEATYLAPAASGPLYDLERFLFAQLRPQIAYRPEAQIRLSQLRNRGGALVPFVLQNSKNTLGIIPLLESAPTSENMATAKGFLKHYPEGRLIFCGLDTQDHLYTPQIRSLNVNQIV